jgi:glycosyltransferase involved in cell wall biosynthesis
MTIAAVATDVAVDIVVPVHNEERDLEPSIGRLHAYLTHALPVRARITIADNASTDQTWARAQALAAALPDVRAIRIDVKGRGHALRAAWAASDAPVVAYMDVDLSTDLAALLPLVAPLLSGHSDIAIGTRLSRHARVIRGPKRELISRAYNLLLHSVLRARFSDAQCGFKAVRADRLALLLPQVEDNGWFFDTELLVRAERAGLRIHEVPVDWTDDPDSRVDVVATAMADLRGVARLVRGQLVRFASIGVVSTIAYLLLYLALRGVTGAQLANATALLVTAVANTAANRRITFGVIGAAGAVRHHAQGLLVFGLTLALTASALGILNAVTDPSRPVEVVALIVANLAATALRFVLLRGWVFRRHVAAGAR